MKFLTYILLALLAAGCQASVPLKWTVETSHAEPVYFNVYRGETLELEATFNSYGRPLTNGLNAAQIFWQTNGMESAWWYDDATVDGNRIRATFTPEMYPDATTVRVFLGVTNSIYRADATLRIRHSPANPNHLYPPIPVLDFDQVEVHNAPWQRPLTAGDNIVITNDVISALGGGGGVTPSEVNEIINTNATVAAKTTADDVNALIEPATQTVYYAAVVDAADYADNKIIDAYNYTDMRLSAYQPLMQAGSYIKIEPDWSINATGLVNEAALAAVADAATNYVDNYAVKFIDGNNISTREGGKVISQGVGGSWVNAVHYGAGYIDVINATGGVVRIWLDIFDGTNEDYIATREWVADNFSGGVTPAEVNEIINTNAVVAAKTTEPQVREIIQDTGCVSTNEDGYVHGTLKIFASNTTPHDYLEVSDGWEDWGARYDANKIIIRYDMDQNEYNLMFPAENGTFATREWATNLYAGAIRTNATGYVDGNIKILSPNDSRAKHLEISDEWDEMGARYKSYGILFRYDPNEYMLQFPQENGTLATREWTTNEINSRVAGNYLPLNRVTSGSNTKNYIRYGSRVSSSYSQVGDYSATFGQRLTAKGARSFAANDGNAAVGNDSAAFGCDNVATNTYTFAIGQENWAGGKGSFVAGYKAKTEQAHAYAFSWSGVTNTTSTYSSKGKGTFCINPEGGAAGFYIGSTNLATLLSQSSGVSETRVHEIVEGDVPSWARATAKPSYTYAEIGGTYPGMTDVSCTVPGISAIKSSVNNNRLEISKTTIPTLVTTNSAIAYYEGMSVRKFTSQPTINMANWPDGEACFVILDLPNTAMAPISNFILTDPSYTMMGRVHTAIYRVGNNLFCSPICTNVGRTDAEM